MSYGPYCESIHPYAYIALSDAATDYVVWVGEPDYHMSLFSVL